MENIPTRLNNPGDLKDPSTGNFQQFDDSGKGFEALLNDLQSKISGTSKTGLGPDSTLVDFSKVYAPASDDNDPGQYAVNLANKLDVAPNTTLGSLRPQIGKFAEAVASNEGFTPSETSAPDSSTQQPSFFDKLASTYSPSNLLETIKENIGTAGPAALFAAGAPMALSAVAGLTGMAGKAIPYIEGALGAEGATKVAGDIGGVISGIRNIGTPSGGISTGADQSQAQNAGILSLGSQLSQAQQQSSKATQSLMQAMQSTPTNRTLLQDKSVQDTLQAMGGYGLMPIIENGNMNFSGAFNQSKNMVADLSKKVSEILDTEGNTANIQEVLKEAKANIRRFAPSHEWQDADEHVEKLGQRYVANFGDENGNISLGNLQRMKQETGYGQKFGLLETSARKNAFKAISGGARTAIEKHTANKELYDTVMREEGKLINARKIMKRLNGKKAPHDAGFKHHLLRESGRLAGAYIGDKIGGPVGAMIGYLASRHLVNAADKKYGKTIFETPAMAKALSHLKNESPIVYKRLQVELQKAGVRIQEEKKKREGLLKLPLPSSIRLGPRQGKSESIVVGGKRAPLSFEQAKKRKLGKSEYGGLHKYQEQIRQSKKAAGLKT